MKEREVFLLFTDTGTYLSKAINYFTRKELNHVSISFSEDLQIVYSFGRKQPNNPIIGGFVVEDVNAEFLAEANSEIYRSKVSDAEYRQMLAKIKEIEAEKHRYRYNFIGLFGVLFRVKIKRKQAYFCSQFVATILKETDCFSINKPIYFITPMDIRSQKNLELIYQGKLKDYNYCKKRLVLGDRTQKQSFMYHLSDKFKQFVMK